MKRAAENLGERNSVINIFMCGDVMTGRGIDQILPYPNNAVIHEPYVKNATEYVRFAEEKNGLTPKPANFSYIWGDAPCQFQRMTPDVRIVNLETSVTKSEEYWRGKEIHYRMNPDNVPCLTVAKIGCCSLANNHVLDWGYTGLHETLETLKNVNIKSAGAGENVEEAESPAILEVKGKGRVLVFSFGLENSGIPLSWAAHQNRPGANLLEDLPDETVQNIKENVESIKG